MALRTIIFAVVFAIILNCQVRADEQVDFAQQIQPLFAQHCLECHGPDEKEGGFRLDDRASALGEADSGSHPITAGDIAASELLVRVTSTDVDLRMPPEGDRIAEADVRLIQEWIKQGAKYNQHWAYRPLVRSTPPMIESSSGSTSSRSEPLSIENPIDRFVLAKLQQQSITPSPTADRFTLIKRLNYDLIGLPPTVAEVDRFVNDTSMQAYEQLVDRLLASPRFGERWGRHWLDKARYADSDGYEKDNGRPNAWRYRDWVIHAINADLPFDQFTVEQLAGDLLPDANDSQHLATAFNRQTLTNTEGGTDREQWRVAAVMDRTETLGAVWLGLTVGCARCHNHKYDQISQDEYYQLYAFFDNGDEVDRELQTLDSGKAKIRVIQQRAKDPRTTRVLRRGEFLEPEHEVKTATLASLTPADRLEELQQQADRLDLARWLVDGSNPLPPRVAANHLWKHLFGEGLVRTVNDFGIRGESPTHPGLLDWLATELIRDDWSRKSLIRTIVLSSTYRQASKHRDELADIDPSNRFLYRQNRFRVEAEVMRDIALSACGLLSNRIGGPSVFPPIPKSVTDVTYNSGFKWKTSRRGERYRRGMYTYFKRTAPHPNLITFDCPSSNVTNVSRETSNTPIGALVTLNNEVYIEVAVAMAKRLLSSFDSDEQRLTELFRICISRVPTKAEVERLSALLPTMRAYYRDNTEAALRLTNRRNSELATWTATSRVVLNLDEFITRE